MEEIEMILKLNLAKLGITKLRYKDQGYDWAMLGEEGQQQMEDILKELMECSIILLKSVDSTLRYYTK